MTAMIGCVIGDVQQNIAAAHGAFAATDKSKIDDLFTKAIGHFLGVADIPTVDSSLCGLQFGQGNADIGRTRLESMLRPSK